jgi:hypothetical protein
MSEWSRGAAWWPRLRSLCTAAAAAWYVRAMYKQVEWFLPSADSKAGNLLLILYGEVNG